MPPNKEVGPRDTTPEGTDTIHITTSHHHEAGSRHSNRASRQWVSSQQVSWWSVHKFIECKLDLIGRFPMIGTPEWCALDDLDARKWAAVYDAAQHWALRLETCQEARAEASHDVSAAADWSGVARAVRRHADAITSGAYIPREAS